MSTFQDRLIEAWEASEMSVAELSRRSGVKYWALYKLLTRGVTTTSADNARKLAAVLGFSLDNDEEVRDEVHKLFAALNSQEQRMILDSMKGLLKGRRTQ